MSTPWTMTRLVRWRVRDWASCFLACRFPLDNEPDRYFTSTPTQMPIRTMVIDRKSIPSRGKENSKKISRRRKGDSETRRNPSSLQVEDSPAVVAVKMTTDDDSSWPQVEDEDYIVFCFKEDGAFDVLPFSDPNCPTEEIKNGNSEASNYIDLVSASSRPVSRKLKYDEDDKAVKICSNEKKISGGPHDIYPTNDGDFIISPQKNKEEEEMESIYIDKELTVGENGTENRNGVHNDHSIVALPTESSDSNHSDISNGSFAFPVLGLEWSGSPVKMPKSEDLQLRKHKPRCVGFQCCKF